jgi:hypothetical protein
MLQFANNAKRVVSYAPETMEQPRSDRNDDRLDHLERLVVERVGYLERGIREQVDRRISGLERQIHRRFEQLAREFERVERRR